MALSGNAIARTFTALRSLPIDVLIWNLDITRFAMNAAVKYGVSTEHTEDKRK